MDPSGAQIHYTLTVRPEKGKEISQERFDKATRLALSSMAAAFADAGVPLASITASGDVSYHPNNPRGGTHEWNSRPELD
jgi:hypothetical protein